MVGRNILTHTHMLGTCEPSMLMFMKRRIGRKGVAGRKTFFRFFFPHTMKRNFLKFSFISKQGGSFFLQSNLFQCNKNHTKAATIKPGEKMLQKKEHPQQHTLANLMCCNTTARPPSATTSDTTNEKAPSEIPFFVLVEGQTGLS